MKKKLLFASVLFAPTLAQGQNAYLVDRTKYPDYSTIVNPDVSLLRYGGTYGTPQGAKRAPRAAQRPVMCNNANTPHFPPVFNQHGGSCGAASRIAYMFTHEVNSYRNLDGSKYENQYPTHFVFLHTMGNSGKDEFVQHIGIPNAPTWGGRTYSSIYGEHGEWTSPIFGWMQGYEKWYSAMFNRMKKPSHLPITLETEQGREALKNYLWNHNGDTDFHSGGIVGVGVASGGRWEYIPQTANNDAAGVTNKWYVQEWGTSVDHALTIVGYDDRIEFDLDKNGIKGERDKDEVGAWIVVNSWGDWCNKGFIYCPYGRATPVASTNGKVSNWWQPEIYHYRKEYRPFRTLKVKMDYSRRSEIKLVAGVASNLSATAPEKTIELEYFRFAGDGHNGDSVPAPETPMLGKWSDGRMHDEPMEFGYDLTDLSSGFDRSQPLKYFFSVHATTKRGSGALGSGHIYNASVLDYEFDRAGNETPFKIESVKDVPGGRVTTISTIVYGEQYTTPKNLFINEGRLQWSAPQNTGHRVAHYNVYKNGEKLGTCTTLDYALQGDGHYQVAAVYDSGVESKKLSITTSVAAQERNVAVNIKNNGFIIPDIFVDKHEMATIEYWIKPNSLSNYNNAGGPGWGNFMFHANADGRFTAGWDINARTNTSTPLRVGQWSHIAMVVTKNNFRLHHNADGGANVSSSNYKGLGGFGSLVFSNSGKGINNATYDEIRIWSKSRSQSEIRNAANVEFSGELMPQNLLAYYKGDIIMINGAPYLRDCVGGHHAPIINTDTEHYEEVPNDKQWASNATGTVFAPTIVVPKNIVVGQTVDFTAKYSDMIKSLSWEIEAAGIHNYKGETLAASFAQAGTHKVVLKGTDAMGKEYSSEKTVTVTPAAVPTADFTLTATQISAGERVSFSPINPVPGYVYEWSMPGAVTQSSQAITAGTSYDAKGEYTIRLRVTSPTGQVATAEKQVSVVAVAPLANFNVLTPVVIKGEKVSIQDLSKYEPTSWTYRLSSPSKYYTIEDAQHPNVVISEPGVYNITLQAKNNQGINSTTQERALFVANADSKNGLNFGSGGASIVTDQVPFGTNQRDVTIEWWMNPSKLSSHCCGIGEGDNSFHIKVDATGAITVARNGRNVTTVAGVVIEREWHHYAITLQASVLRIYCDGQQIKIASLAGTSLPALGNFSIGTSAAPMNGMIDEFRIWGTALTEKKLQSYINQPIADVAAAQNGTDKLLLYYDFNHNSGNVLDRTATGNNATRRGFGPDGDAWALSKGVFSLNFAKETAQDVSNKLRNYKFNFAFDPNQPINKAQNNRWYAVKDWILENSVTSSTGAVTGVHVDRIKGDRFTVATKWDGFADELKDHKAYQVITLPAGIYTLTTTYTNINSNGSSAATGSYLVVNKGNSLPNTADLNEALAYNAMSNTGLGAKNTLSFSLSEETQVAIGVLINMTGQNIAMIDAFELKRSDNEVVTAIRPLESLKTQGSKEIYDLSGRRIETPQRGQIYLQGGQRILVL